LDFFDEASPQTTANTQRFWSFGTQIVRKNTTKYKANTFGFYALIGIYVVDFEKNSKKSICIFIKKILSKNPEKHIVVILDNFTSHNAINVREKSKKCDIELVYLPVYSPHLNPIEYIRNSIKRTTSKTFIESHNHMKELIRVNFLKYASRISFAKSWIE